MDAGMIKSLWMSFYVTILSFESIVVAPKKLVLAGLQANK
jgi:hypothetical protein